MNIFEHTDYKSYFKEWVKQLPKNGHGEFRRVSQHLNVSTTMVSQVFNGEKHMSLELASDLCDYLNLNEMETDYFFLLVEYARAGSFKLKQKLHKRLLSVQKEAQKLETRLKKDKDLPDETKLIFYSSWIYSAIRNLVALPTINDVQAIADHFHLPRPQIQKTLEFLIKEGLVIQKSGKLDVGHRRTHLSSESPLAAKHHQNWRINGFQKMSLNDAQNLFYTAPMSVSEDVAQKIRQELPAFIEKLHKWIVPSPSETTRCLNIDWFEF